MDRHSTLLMSFPQQQLAHALYCGIEVTDLTAVENALSAIQSRILGSADSSDVLVKLVADTVGMFRAGFTDKQPVDTPYHDLEHTLQTTLCFAQIALNWALRSKSPALCREGFQNGLAAALLHDVGYMKDAHDPDGSGAKHTHGHELRSCEIARAYLGRLGWDPARMETVCSVIRCTGLLADSNTIDFTPPTPRILGQMVCTADYLGQIADPRYVDKIPALFCEFKESDQVRSIAPEDRNYASLDDLLMGTHHFWNSFVEPRLRAECGALYELLSSAETGSNAYLNQVEANLKRIENLKFSTSS